MKNKQSAYKEDGDSVENSDPVAPAMPGQKKESPFAPVRSSKKPKKQKIDPNSDLARLTRERKAKKKNKRAGTGNHPMNK